MKRFFYVLVISIVFAPCLGCGGPKGDPVSVANSEASYTEAKTMVLDGNYEPALPKLEAAIAGGGLGPDLYVEALLLRAQCYATSGQLDQAAADMEKAEQGSPSEAMIELTKGVILEKQGNSAESKAAFAKAKRLDPTLKLPK
ncbi:MAG: tetratricopeptide repeat protein [Pirellula sp.]|jgi:tetratricopeptide (TPR) repeat protein